jgi:hypothetical protein
MVIRWFGSQPRAVLACAGYLVLRVHSRLDAPRYLRSIKADLAICDLTEKEILCDIYYADPEMSVLGSIRKDEPPFRATKNALGKPFTASELLNAVRRCLAAH